MMNLASSNVWVIPEFPTVFVSVLVAVGVASTLGAMGIAKYRRHLFPQIK